MDIDGYLSQWKDREVVAFSGPLKFRGVLTDVLGGGFIVLNRVAVINPATPETPEYETCVININEIAGIGYEEIVGRGVAGVEGY